ncbi:MAG: GxxExxY protein [Candidatus Omnitrophica bacterium]|nr:GxxExxY protein [Candidatus Omnitrophota bacterium]
MDVFYKGEKVGVYIPDFIIDSKIIIEIKSKAVLLQEDKKQFWYYLTRKMHLKKTYIRMNNK